MNKNFKLTQERLTLFYYENKEYLVPVLAIVIAIFLFFIFLLPQLLSFPARKQAIDSENEVLRRVKETERIVISQDSEDLDSKIKTVSNALPPGKNFEQILNGISTAAALSGTQLENYQFQNLLEPAQGSKYPTLEFKVTIIGDAREAINFVKELYKTYPVSDVIKIDGQDSFTTITVNFFYKPFPSVGGEDRINLKDLTTEQKKILNDISKWNNQELGSIIDIVPNATSSAEERTSPF